MSRTHLQMVSALFALALSGAAFAATITDNFTGTSATNTWTALNYACLTAGSGSGSSIPACSSPNDPAGSGALRLTPASNGQTGAILSGFAFPSNQGLQVTFTTYTYGGDSGGTAKDGADGIGFFLTDGSLTAPTTAGGLGGSLGYSCSNSNSVYDGLAGGYLGLGIDEYGNFLNSGDNTSTGILNTNSTLAGVSTVNGTNTFSNGANNSPGNSSGRYYQPNRIGLRGAGNVNWAWLSTNYPNLYSGSPNSTAVKNTCSTGLLQNGSSGTQLYLVPSTSPLSWAGGVLTVKTSVTTPIAVGNTVVIGTTNSSYIPKSNGVSILGTYVVTAVGSNQFSVSLPGGSNTFTNAKYTNVAISVMNYAAIPNGYWVLPSNQLIANESASTRTNAWPITYKLLITPAGYLSFMYSYNGGTYQPVLTNQSITASNGAVPANFRFGFSASTGGSNNIHEITCFQAQPIQSASSVGANTIQSGQVKIGTQIYLAYYNSNNWWGSLVADPLVVSSGTLSASTTANWDANCVLTGGACTNTNNTNTTTLALSPSSRQLLTWSGSAGIPLEWANITSSQQTTLNSTDTLGQSRLNWLRGDRTKEQLAATPGPLRARTGVLGDIIDSSPTWVGPPSMAYISPFSDAVYGGSSAPENATGAPSYSTYASSNATRTNVVYSGSNDGLLHGFRSGSYNSDGSYNSTNNDGLEVIGFMPSSVLANANVVGLTNPTYGHSYFVNATPGTGDLFYGSAWHTWLVGGLGSGGAEIYALDITDPSQFSETNAASLVMGDWTAATLANLGNTFGTPLIRRLHNGQWAIIFGNGFGSSTQHAGIYIGLVDSTTGAVTFQWLDTGMGSSSSPDGIAYVASADLDGDHVTDYLYAGDLLGNVWRFDLTSSNPVDWGVSKFGNTTPTPLFTAISGSTPQPITTKISVASTLVGGAQRVMVMFGTGQKTPATSMASDTFATGTQTFYGIWDWNMNTWNNGITTASSVVIPASGTHYSALAAPQSFTRSSLLAQTLNSTTTGTSGSQVLGYRLISNANNVCWQGGTTCATGNTQYGWYFDLPVTNEQIIYNPVIVGGAVVVNTTIPPSMTAGQCNQTLQTGWTMAFNIGSGGGFQQNFFPSSAGSLSASSAGATIAGIQTNGVGSISTVKVGNTTSMISQTSGGNPYVGTINPQNGTTGSRVTWEEIR